MAMRGNYQSDNFHKRVFTEKELARIIELREKHGLTWKVIATRFSCSVGMIQHAMKRLREKEDGQASSEAVEG